MQHDENAGTPPAAVFEPSRIEVLMELDEDGDTTMVRDIAGQFFKDVEAVMENLPAYIAANDFVHVASAAHTIKGGSATFGLYLAEKIARELEAAAKTPEKNGSVASLYDSLKEAYLAGKSALEEFFSKR